MKQTTFFIMNALLVMLLAGCNEQQEPLFNGNDLQNWHFVLEDNAVPAEEVFLVEDGTIRIMGEPLGYMYTEKRYRNFTLSLEYRWADGESNSGVFVLIDEPLSPFPSGIECQLAAGKAGDFVLLGGSDMNEYILPEGVTERPAFPVIAKQQPSSEMPVGEWNKVRVTVNEGIITVYVNDVLQNSATSEVREGHIGLQSEGKEIQFRNLKLRQ